MRNISVRDSNQKNQKGVILLTVVLLTVILSMLVIGIMSVNIGQVKKGEDVLESIRVEELAKGIFYQYQQSQTSGSTGGTPTEVVIYDNGKQRKYDIVTTSQLGAGPNGTAKVKVSVATQP